MSAFKSYFYARPTQETLKTDAYIETKYAPVSPPPERVNSWSWHRPRTWGKKTYAAIVLLVAAIVVAIAVPLALARKTKPYPNYYKINYQLQETWSGNSFFNNFDYFIQPDPTQGFVSYVNEGIAKSKNLTYSNNNAAVIRVDDVTNNTTGGRDSIRLVSKKGYNGGLFLFDVAHVPYGCGTWPSIWMTSINNWPNQGEIDIMETVNQAGPNQMTLHTSSSCSMGGYRNQTGTTLSTDCNVGSDFSGSCAVMGSANSAGQAFNNIGGGLYALEWRSEGIRMWFFERNNIPANIASPDPSSWPVASADFPNTNCDIGSHFSDLHIITNIALCGVWAGASDVYNGQDHCPNSCVNYVTANASAFEQAYFTYNSFKIFAAS